MSLFTFSSLITVTACVYFTVSGQTFENKETALDGHIDQIRAENILKNIQPVKISPKTRKRRSTLNARTRREVSSLVAGLNANVNKLDNLTREVEYLVKSTNDQLIGYTDETKRLEAMNARLINKLEQMNPVFVFGVFITCWCFRPPQDYRKIKKQ